jgi:hypothetical protein
MKKNINLGIFLSILSFLWAGCDDFLDKQQDDMLTFDDIFSSRTRSQSYLSSVYSFIPDEVEMQNNYNLLGICDEGDFIWVASWARQINVGNWDATSGYYDKWGKFYQGIRSATTFICNIDKNDDPTLDPEVKASWKQEAKALRAIYYFYLLRQYGPFVIMPEEPIDVNIPTEELFFKRNTFETCLEYLLSEFDAIINNPDLPIVFENDQDKGRIDRRTVMAFKGRLLLLAASPFWNGNPDHANFKNSDGTPMVTSTSKDITKWQKAANANKELIDNILRGGAVDDGLYGKTENGVLNPLISYRDVFLDRWNKEVIYARPQMASSNANNGWERHCAPRVVNGWNGIGISQQMIDSYFMANGEKYNQSTEDLTKFSTSDDKYTKAGTNWMYVGREPRFYASIIYNGADWIYRENGKPILNVELFNEGNCGKSGSHDYSATGYLCCKNISPSSDLANWTGALRSLVMIRLAEIYLNYAEALNEAQDNQSARDEAALYVNAIRKRAGIPDLTADKTATQSAMQQAIRDERRVELAFENFRAWDTRRWKIAEETDGAPLMGMNVDAGTTLKDVEFYKRTLIEKRTFPKKFYLWPIPQSEINKNKACVQNPGW